MDFTNKKTDPRPFLVLRQIGLSISSSFIVASLDPELILKHRLAQAAQRHRRHIEEGSDVFVWHYVDESRVVLQKPLVPLHCRRPVEDHLVLPQIDIVLRHGTVDHKEKLRRTGQHGKHVARFKADQPGVLQSLHMDRHLRLEADYGKIHRASLRIAAHKAVRDLFALLIDDVAAQESGHEKHDVLLFGFAESRTLFNRFFRSDGAQVLTIRCIGESQSAHQTVKIFAHTIPPISPMCFWAEKNLCLYYSIF